MSAIADNNDGPVEVIKVLFALYPGYNTLDVAGPLEILSRSLHDAKDKCTSPLLLFTSAILFHCPFSICPSLFQLCVARVRRADNAI